MFQKIAEFILQERLRELENRVAELERITKNIDVAKAPKKGLPEAPAEYYLKMLGEDLKEKKMKDEHKTQQRRKWYG